MKNPKVVRYAALVVGSFVVAVVADKLEQLTGRKWG